MRRFVAVAAALGVAVAFSLVPPGAAQTVPEVVQITDPVGDANGLNDQDDTTICSPPPCQGDVDTADAGSVSDFMAGWFTHTATEISLHIQTEAPPPASTTIYYRMAASPNDDQVKGCLNIRAVFPGVTQGQSTSTYLGDQFTEIEDVCNADGTLTDGTITIADGPDGTGITTLTFPRSVSPLLADGQVISGAYLVSRITVGADRENWAAVGQTDNTMRGTDYTITPLTPPGKGDPPGKGKKKGCPKGKGKKKGACPSPSPSGSPTPSPTPTG